MKYRLVPFIFCIWLAAPVGAARGKPCGAGYGAFVYENTPCASRPITGTGPGDNVATDPNATAPPAGPSPTPAAPPAGPPTPAGNGSGSIGARVDPTDTSEKPIPRPKPPNLDEGSYELAGSGGGGSNPNQIIASDAGFDTIGKYVEGASLLIQEQDQSTAFLNNFRKKMAQLEDEHRQLAQMYAQKAAESRAALARMQQVPDDDRKPVASRTPTNRQGPAESLPSASAPYQAPNLSGFAFPSFSQNASEPASAPQQYPSESPRAQMADALQSFETNLGGGGHIGDSDSGEVKHSTIATQEDEKAGGGSKKDDAEKLGLVRVKGGKSVKAQAKKSLRDALKAAMARKDAAENAAKLESGSQGAARAVLEEAALAAQGRGLASATDGQSGSFAGGGGFSTAGFGQPDLQNGAVSLGGDGASAQMKRLRGELEEGAEENAAPEVLGRDTQDLFERVRGAHQRSQKNGRLRMAQS